MSDQGILGSIPEPVHGLIVQVAIVFPGTALTKKVGDHFGMIEVVRRAEDGSMTCADARIADVRALPF